MTCLKYTRALVAVAMLALSLSAFAADKKADTKTSSLELSEAVTVAGKALQPGSYKLQWTGTGSEVQLSFLQFGKTVAQVPAQVTAKGSGGSTVVLTKKTDQGSMLQQIRLKKQSLVFNDATSANGQ